jgi:hypothetical protein
MGDLNVPRGSDRDATAAYFFNRTLREEEDLLIEVRSLFVNLMRRKTCK